jgi:hypothetical protein
MHTRRTLVALSALAAASLAPSPVARALKVLDEKVILEKLDDYEQCQRRDYSGELCHEALERWVEEHPADAFRAGRLTRRHMNAAAAVTFFHKALSAKQGDCGDEDVALATLGGLELSPDPESRVIPKAQAIAFELCFDKLRAQLVDGVAAGRSTYLANACRGLTGKKALSGLKAQLCQHAR